MFISRRNRARELQRLPCFKYYNALHTCKEYSWRQSTTQEAHSAATLVYSVLSRVSRAPTLDSDQE